MVEAYGTEVKLDGRVFNHDGQMCTEIAKSECKGWRQYSLQNSQGV